MKIQMEISEFDFAARLRNYQQWENATGGELACLFFFLEEYSECEDEPIEFDPVAWACEFNILSVDEIIRENEESVIDFAFEMDLIDDYELEIEEVLKILKEKGYSDEDILNEALEHIIDDSAYNYEGYYLFHAC